MTYGSKPQPGHAQTTRQRDAYSGWRTDAFMPFPEMSSSSLCGARKDDSANKHTAFPLRERRTISTVAGVAPDN